jgi:hypothetical protein
MIWTGLVEEGMEVVKTIRERYRGYNRNPWGEIESGMYYARAMASWSILLALSGFEYDGVEQFIKFDPKINQDDFSTFWSCGNAWGNYKQDTNQASVGVLFGTLKLKSIKLQVKSVNRVLLNKKEVDFTEADNLIIFEKPVSISEGNTLTIQ